MNKKLLILGMALNLLALPLAWSYLEDLKVIELKDGRQILLGFDSYKDYSIERNRLQATLLISGIVNLAKSDPKKRIDFNYEDPGIYAAGNIIPPSSALLTAASSLAPGAFIGLASKEGGASFDLLAFSRPKFFTSFLGGDFTRLVSIFAQEINWPHNLIIRSNDPRQEHYLALSKDIDYLKANGEKLYLKDFILPAWGLRNKELYFNNQNLDEQASQALFEKIEILRKSVQEQLEAFANFIAMKSTKDFSVAELAGMTIAQAQEKMDLAWIYEYKAYVKSVADVYVEAPRVDLLLSIFDHDAPDFFAVILGNDNAAKFEQDLKDLNVIESICPLGVDQAITKMVMSVIK